MSRSVERDVRPGPEPREADACPDAETIAAWADRGLAPSDRAQMEAHVADCARCQMHLAMMAKMMPAEAAAAPSRERLRGWRWLIPATGAIAAAGLWLLVQAPPAPTPPENPRDVRLHEPEQKAVPGRVESSRADEKLAAQLQDAVRKQAAAAKDPAKADKREVEQFAVERRRQAADAAASAPATPPPAAEQAAPRALAEKSVVQQAPQANVAEIHMLAVQRLADGRLTWETRPDDISAQLTAGVSPTASAFWLVGKAGLVLVSADGRSWRRVPFPERVDLTALQVSSLTDATVTTIDARTFTTSDGGQIWQRR